VPDTDTYESIKYLFEEFEVFFELAAPGS